MDMGIRRLVQPLRLRSEGGLEPGRRVTWLELFFDLVFVAAVAQVGTHLQDDYSLDGLLRFSLLFLLIWCAWLGHTTFSTRFDTDDLIQRGLTALQMFLVAVMAVNATGALDSRDSAGFAAAYAVMRLVLVAQYLRARRISRARALVTRYASGCGIAAALWMVSALVPAPGRFWIWALALLIDVCTPLISTRHLVDVPHDAAHLPERYGLFTIILLGESMVAVMTGMERQEYWSPRAASSAVLGMGLVFAIWWWYFDGVEAAAERGVRSHRDGKRFHIWSYAHFPLYLGIAVAGVGVEHIIATATGEPLHAPEAWILGSAVAVAAFSLLAMGAVSVKAEGAGALAEMSLRGLPIPRQQPHQHRHRSDLGPMPGVLDADLERQPPLLEEDPVGLDQPVAGIVDVRRLRRHPVQLDDRESLAVPKRVDRRRAHVEPSEEEPVETVR
jgi:low temperature requirement protein LtrA